MIDTDNLRTASLYINNQLLSRGLVRDGDLIDFASAGMDDGDGAATCGRIISVLNDLILRRDVRTSLIDGKITGLYYVQTKNANSGCLY